MLWILTHLETKRVFMKALTLREQEIDFMRKMV